MLTEEQKAKLVQAQNLISEVLRQAPVVTETPPLTFPTNPPIDAEEVAEAESKVTGFGDPNGLCWGNKLEPDERRFVRQMAIDFSTKTPLDPDWFMACFALETMETFSTTIRPKRKDGTLVSTAVGLIQWLEKTAKEQGTTTAAIARMSRMQQLELAWKYFKMRIKQFGHLESLEDIYMAIHWPSAIGKPLSATMYAKGTSAYAANAGLDVNKDHIITKAEAGALVRAKLAKGYKPENVFIGIDP